MTERRDNLVGEVLSGLPQPEDNGARATDTAQVRASLLSEKLLDFDGIKNLLAPTWRIHGVLPDDGLAVLYGHPGTYKSFIALDWALCVATETPWKGCEVVRGRVLYVIAESPAGLGQRARAWEKVNRLTPSDVRFLPMAVNLLDPEWAAALALLADELDADVCIVDTLSRSMVGGNENSPESMTAAVAGADRLRRGRGSTVLVHHKPRDGSNPRGHTALEGAADTMIEVAASDGRITLRSRKTKNAEPFADLHLTPTPVELSDDGDSLANSLVLDVGEAWTGRGLEHETDARVVHALSTEFRITGATRGVLQEHLELSRSGFYKCVNRLLERGAVVKAGTKGDPTYRVDQSGEHQ